MSLRDREQPATRSSGFTLIEVVISAALMALILTSGYVCLNAAISTQKMVEPRGEILQNARVALNLIAADLRCACPLSKETDFTGMHRMLGTIEADNLDFATHNYTPRAANEGDYCQESIFLNPDPETGQLNLCRRRNPRIGLDPFSGGRTEELAKAVVGLRFEYSDGLDWYDSWGEIRERRKAQNSLRVRTNLEGLPEAVRITLYLASNPKAKPSTDEKAPKEPALVFQTVARLNLAASARSAANSVSTGNESDATQNMNQGQEGGQ
jgi:prepilin-type N-terminal cleavage/methylation domain-containing protein